MASYQDAVRAAPNHGDAWYALANLKTYAFSEDELERMRRQEDAPGQPLQNRINLCFALAKACEDRKAFDEAFSYYERGNALKKHQTRYTAEQMEAEFEAQKAACTPALFQAQAGKGDPSPDPIFIVGLPRAGSTLLEQILASHSQVDGTLELPNILSISHTLRGATSRLKAHAILQTCMIWMRTSWPSLAGNTSMTRRSIARARLSSPTRCRTISAISV